MRIGIDARLAGSRHGGIGRYIEELIRSLLVLKTSNEFVVFLHDLDQLPWLRHGMKVKIVLAPISHYSMVEQWHMPKLFMKEHLDLLHVPHFNVPLLYKGAFVVTIHDLLWHERKDRQATTLSPIMHAVKYTAYTKVAEAAIRRARRVIVPTMHVAQVIERITGRDDAVVIPEGVSEAYVPKGKTFGYTFPYLIYVGSLYPHKNVPFIFHALEKFPDLHLVVVSGRSVFQDRFTREAADAKLTDRVHLHEYLKDVEIAQLLRGTIALVTPSFSEGFGLPGLEAMATGAPVIASDIAVFHEVYAGAACYVDPEKPAELAVAVQKIRTSLTLRKKMIDHGVSISKEYSWSKMAKRTVQLYEDATA